MTLITAALLVFASSLSAQQYYVSPNGNDNNPGNSTAYPWQTIAKVNSFIFPAGSTVSFEGGQTFTGCLIFNTTNVPSSSPSTPFTVNSYGTGAATISSNCSGTTGAAITADNVSGFTLNGVRLVNGGSTIYGVLLENQTSNSPTQNIVIKNSEITGFAPVSGSSNGGEIYIIGYAMNGNNGPLNNVQILNNTLHGASVTSGDGAGIGGYGYGKNITNVLVQGNSIYNLGMPAATAGAGILADGWSQGTIQYNVVHDIGANVTSCGGASGIETYTSNKITIRFNEVYNVQPSPSFTKGCDWDGIDLDGGTTNSIVEYNYTHHNAGSGLLAYNSSPTGTTWGPNTYRYNISENDDWAKAQGGLFNIVPGNPPNAISIYGNTFFDNVTTQKSMSSSSACFYFGYSSGSWASGSLIEDNICYMNDFDTYGRNGNFIYNPNGETGMTLSNNLYYTTGNYPIWRWGGTQYKGLPAWTTLAVETNPVFADPLFASNGNGGTCTWTPSLGNGPQPCPQAYQLQSNSLALGAGVTVANNGGVDYFQSPLTSPPSIGAYSGTGGSTGTPVTTPPPAPASLMATATSVDQINLTWTASPTAWSYNIYRGSVSGFSPSSSNLIASGVANATFTDTGLTFGTTYYYLVAAVNGAGTSSPSNEASATTPQQPQYYVSPTGNDTNPGTVAAPWQTISKVNSFTFPEGSIVAFQGGATFTGCLVINKKNVPNSSASNPFTLTSYSGTATISSNCSGTTGAAITGDSVDGFTVDGLKIVNGSSTIYGVLLENQSTTWPTQSMTVKNSEITGFAPVSGNANGGEIWIIGYALNGNKGPINNIQILNNSLHGAAVTSPDGVGIGGFGYGQNITNVLVQGNTVYNLGMPAAETGAGILADGWSTGTIQHNLIHDIGANVTSCGGTSGIETYNSNAITVAYNEVFNVQPSPAYSAGCDWNGIDLDGGTTNSTVEYNYTHNNAGAGYLGYNGNPSGTTWGPNTYRYNISENDDLQASEGGAFVIVPNAPPHTTSIYGNTIFNNQAERASAVPACFSFGYAAGTWASGSLIADNICNISNPSGGVNLYNNPYGQTGMTLSNNLYFSTSSPTWVWGSTSYNSIASWQAAGFETAAFWSDPQFAGPGNGGTCSWSPSSGLGLQPCPQAYQLHVGSPAFGNGLAVSDNGGVDYYGNPLASPPSIGAYSGSSSGATSTLVTLSDLSASDYSAVPSSYQPVGGMTITWNGLFRNGANSWDGYQDHTQSITAGAPSIDLGTSTHGTGTNNTGSMYFSVPVTIPSLYVTNWDWWDQDVVLKGYTHSSDTTPVVTITVPYSSIPYHPTGTVTGAWQQVTGLAGTPLQRLDVIGTKNSSTSQYGAALVDDITINH